MGARSDIEWTDATWTPIRARNRKTGKVGWHCEKPSPGCKHCYAESINRRLGTGLPFKPGHRKDVELFLDEKMLTAPLHWPKPSLVFPCSMTDLFGEFVPDAWIDRMFAVMALCPQHRFQVLTKRAERMRAYKTTPDRKRTIAATVMEISELLGRQAGSHKAKIKLDHFSRCFAGSGPFPNVWMGGSAEDQRRWDERLEHLAATPAAVRWVSVEPQLGHIDAGNAFDAPPDGSPYQPIDWVVCGGESGPGARPMHPDWPRWLRDQCAMAGVPFFFKQWGAWSPDAEHESEYRQTEFLDPNGGRHQAPGPALEIARQLGRTAARHLPMSALGVAQMYLKGKKAAGRVLDSRTHDGMPA